MSRALLINATILNQLPMIGLGIYSYNLLSELFASGMPGSPFEQTVLIGDPARLSKLFPKAIADLSMGTAAVTTCHPVRRLFDLNSVAKRARKYGEVLLYSPTHHGVTVAGIRQVVTVHDLFPLVFPRNHRQQYYYFRYYLPRVIKNSGRIIAVSRHTAEDLKRYFSVLPPCETVLEGLRNDLVDIQPEPIEALKDKLFFLFLGPNFKYKNADRLIEAFAELTTNGAFGSHQLVFAGGRERYITFLRDLIRDRYSAISDRIHFLGYVSTGELAWLYQHAQATMITTLYEGFGLPALEAMSFGCPVVASKVASLPEVCGDAALMVDPCKVEQIAGAMKRIAQEPGLRHDLASKGRLNLTRFSWRQAAEQVWQVLKEV